MEKLTIKNRKNQKIVLLLDLANDIKTSRGLAFVMHGLGGNKDQPHIQAMMKTFKEAEYTVVSFDSTNTIGESEGNLEDATITGYYQDLEDVISWASKQKWYSAPFILAGHSLGALSCVLFAENYPEKVEALAPISTVVSWDMSSKTKSPEDLESWKKKGVKEWVSHSGKIKRLKWAFVEDRMKYDVLPNIKKLTMPVLLVVGELDNTTPVEHQQYFYERLPGKKEIHIIKGSEHTFRKNNEIEALKGYFDNWIKNL